MKKLKEKFYIFCYFLSFNKNQVQRCIELVSRAKKPVILLGSQATLPPTPADDIRLRTMFYAPVFFTSLYCVLTSLSGTILLVTTWFLNVGTRNVDD